MEIRNLTPGGFASNCYLVREGSDAVLIDCTADPREVEAALEGATLHAILLTHGHFDHMLSTARMKARFGVPILLHGDDADLPSDGEKNAHALFFGSDVAYLDADRSLEDGEQLRFGALTLTVRHTPGHTRGCVMYRARDALFTGDTIFAAGYGRTDLYGGNAAVLRATLGALDTLPEGLRIYPGHGGTATLKEALNRLF